MLSITYFGEYSGGELPEIENRPGLRVEDIVRNDPEFSMPRELLEETMPFYLLQLRYLINNPGNWGYLAPSNAAFDHLTKRVIEEAKAPYTAAVFAFFALCASSSIQCCVDFC